MKGKESSVGGRACKIACFGSLLILMVAAMPMGVHAHLEYDFYLSGVAYDEDLEPIPYVNVTCHKLNTNDTITDVTDDQGNFEFNLVDMQNGYEATDQFEIHVDSESYAIITGPSPYYGLQSGISGYSLWNPLISGISYFGNYALSYRTNDDAHHGYAQDPYYVEGPARTFFAGWTISDYNPYQADLISVGSITFSATHLLNTQTDYTIFDYTIEAGDTFSDNGWLSIDLSSGDFDGQTTFSFTFSGTWSAGGSGSQIYVHWGLTTYLDWY